MSRTGIEEKPEWRTVPSEIRTRVGETLGSPVARAMRIWGGYGPSPTYRLRLENGKRAFLKGIFPGSNEFQIKAHDSELRVYRELHEYITPWAPGLLGEFTHDQWRIILLEDLGPKTAPPWRKSDVKAAARGLAEFHAKTINIDNAKLAENLRFSGILNTQLWKSDITDETINSLASIAGPQSVEAARWLNENSHILAEAAGRLIDIADSMVLMHLDVRSDNLRVNSGRLRMFDWPHATIGPPEFELAAFAQSVEAEDGSPAEYVLNSYEEKAKLNPEVLISSVVSISGYFANQSWQPDIPGLPRLRTFQRQQLSASLRWASRLLELEPPTWLSANP